MAIIQKQPESLRVGTGLETVFGFDWPYMADSDIIVTVAGVQVPTVLVSPAQVQVTPAPGAGVLIRIYRNTPAQYPAYSFDRGIPFLPKYVDANNSQLLHALQEGLLVFSKVENTSNEAKEIALAASASASAATAATQHAVRTPADEPGVQPLPYAAARAGKSLGFDSEGRPVVADLSSGSIGEFGLDLAGPAGATRVGFRLNILGAKVRTLASRLGDRISVMDFGAIGDGLYHPLSELYGTDLALAQFMYPSVAVTSLTQSIDWAAHQAAANTGRAVYAPTGTYVLTDSVVFKPAGSYYGDGHAPWTPGSAVLCRVGGGTEILMYGTGAKIWEIDHIGAGGGSYGSQVNPDASAPYGSFGRVDQYDLTDLTNGDAAGAQRATLRKVSAAFVIPVGGNVRLDSFRLVPYHRGQQGYLDMSDTTLGADWDMGILNLGCYSRITDLQVVGYWRIAALAKLATPVAAEVVQGESDHIQGCILQGFRSMLVRTLDQFAIVSTSDANRTVRIRWGASHRFTPSGKFRLAGTDRTYTGLTYVLDGGVPYLEFQGVSGPLGSYGSIFTIRATSSHFGTSGTTVFDCTMGGLTHHSRLNANSNLLTPRFTNASAAVEISGGPLRAIQFVNCSIVGGEDILVQLNFCSEIQFIGCYFEGQATFTKLNDFSNQNGRGGRIIATRGTANLDFIACTYHSPSVDRRPTLSPGSLSETRFTLSGTGLFVPNSWRDDAEMFGMVNSSGDMRSRNLAGNYEIEAGANLRLTQGPAGAVLIGPSSGSAPARFQSLTATLHVGVPIRMVVGNTAGTAAWHTFDAGRIYSQAGVELGGSTNPYAKSYVVIRYYSASVFDAAGGGSPEGVVTAAPGSTWRRTDPASGLRFFVKESGSGNTGWVAK